VRRCEPDNPTKFLRNIKQVDTVIDLEIENSLRKKRVNHQGFYLDTLIRMKDDYRENKDSVEPKIVLEAMCLMLDVYDGTLDIHGNEP